MVFFIMRAPLNGVLYMVSIWCRLGFAGSRSCGGPFVAAGARAAALLPVVQRQVQVTAAAFSSRDKDGSSCFSLYIVI